MIHLGDKACKHAFSLIPLALQVLHDPTLALGKDNVDHYLALLSETPATADGLVILLETVRRKIGDMAAALEVQAPSTNLRLRYQDSRPAFGKVDQATFFHFVAIRSCDLDRVRDQLLQQVPFFVEMTPDQGGAAGVGHHGGHLFTSLTDGALLFRPLLP